MQVARVRIINFRCLSELELELADPTVLVGANGTGKSSVLHALSWFFSGGMLDIDDVAGRQDGVVTSVSVTFRDFSDADREALGRYVIEDEAVFERSWSPDAKDKLTGRALASPAFEHIRAMAGAGDRIAAYRALREEQSSLGLPPATSGAVVEREMTLWEAEHPEELERASTSATHLFGATGTARLAGRFDFVLVPAVLDMEKESKDARGTLLRQLLDRSGDRTDIQARLRDLTTETRRQADEIIGAGGQAALDELAQLITEQLQRLVPDSSVSLRSAPSLLDVPLTDIQLRIADAGFETDVGRQGHGVQRSLLMALVQQLSATAGAEGTDDGGSGLLLAIEEPELYQHPLQARHLASTLRRLGRVTQPPIQVLYATHSEHFVDATTFETLRRFEKHFNPLGHPTATVTAATLARVGERLAGIVPEDQVATRTRITLRRHLDEAVFSRATVVVEGTSDSAFLAGLAERSGGLDSAGIAVVPAGGKMNVLLPWAILTELGVPTYVIFDGDASIRERMAGRDEKDIAGEEAKAQRDNRAILNALGHPAEDWPETAVSPTLTVFRDHLETELTSWTGFATALEGARATLEEYREKPDDAYRLAAANMSETPPLVFTDMLEAILELRSD